MKYASLFNQVMSKGGPQIRKAGQKLGDFLLRPEGPIQQVARDTLAYTAAEQVVPRVFGGEAPPIEESLIRQAGGNIVAEGVTKGLERAFPDRGVPIGRTDSKGNVNFRPSGIDPKLARGIGEFAGQAAGTRIADSVLPGKQSHPFLGTDGTPTRAYGDLEDRYMGGQMSAAEEKQFEALDKQLFRGGNQPQAQRPGHPVSPTGAIPATHEPESAQVERRDFHDLIFQKQLEAQADRQHYANRIALANAQNRPRQVIQRVEQDPMRSAMSVLQEGYRPTRYG